MGQEYADQVPEFVLLRVGCARFPALNAAVAYTNQCCQLHLGQLGARAQGQQLFTHLKFSGFVFAMPAHIVAPLAISRHSRSRAEFKTGTIRAVRNGMKLELLALNKCSE